jgi:predicted ATPase
VIAGKPGTGKSYVMKFMYAVDEAWNLYGKSTLNFSDNVLKLIEKLEEKKVSGNNYKISKEEYAKELGLPINAEGDTQNLDLKNILSAIFSNIDQISENFRVEFGEDWDNSVEYKNFNIEAWISKKDSSNNVIFVETPLILEFKKFMKREKGKTPYHIESLLNVLDTDYSFTDEEQDKFINDFTQKSKEIIKGDIESSGDSFIFNKEGDKNYDIVNASSGTKSIGLLQYLVTNKALKKGSVLYWEEPEVHLHPEWQLKMIELFIELMNAGVKIVFSTHSTFMVDSLNALSKKEGFSDRVSFNLFKETDGIVENHILEADKEWKLIQDELLKSSLEEIMWQYL